MDIWNFLKKVREALQQGQERDYASTTTVNENAE
jgi:hypothetical protein